MRTSEITAVLNPRWTIEEVFETWRARVADWLFIGNREGGTRDEAARLWAPSAGAEPIDWKSAVERRKTFEELRLPLGIRPRLRSSQAPLAIEVFETPGLPETKPDAPEPTALAWYRSAPVMLQLSRHTEDDEYPSFFFSVALAEGTQGLRDQLLRALVHVLAADREELGPWPAGEALIAEAKRAQTGIKTWESEVDLDGLQRAIELATSEVVEKFGFSGTASILSSGPPPGDPVDLSMAWPAADRAAFARPAFEEMVNALWTVRLASEGLIRERAVAYWTRHREGPEWQPLWVLCAEGLKSTWPTLVEILSAPPFSDDRIDDLCSFLQDPNWPGAGESWDFFRRNGAQGLAMLDASIERQRAFGNTRWGEALAPWREMLVDELAKK